jgi:hypothetical protein
MLRLALLTLVAAPALAQTEKHPELGMTFTCPGGYERLPVRPRERFGVLSFVDRSGPSARPATLDVYVVPGAAGDVTDGEGFVRDVLSATKVVALSAGRRRYGYEPRRFGFEVVEEGATLTGWAHAWEGPARAYVIVGRCLSQEAARHRPSWVRSAENLRMFAPVSLDAERKKWERYYGGRRGMIGVDRRIRARLDLVEGWRLRDSDHYVVLSHEVDEGLVMRMTTEVESLRAQFSKLCPPDGVLDQVSVVRICRDEVEYLAYGGRQGSVGYWSPAEEELVLFDARGAGGPEVDGEHYTRAVLFHEAFHQYVFYAAEGISPHPWFDEGLAEYFGGAVIEGRRFSGIEPNRYRLEAARSLLEGGAYPWAAATAMEQGEFYADPGRLYAQGWSMVHFLASSPEAQGRRAWSRILPTYFQTLRSAWSVERRRLTASGGAEPARRRARARAWAAAFEGVDWGKLEASWRLHLSSLRVPRAR